MKVCSKCHIEKDESEFRKHPWCKKCKNKADYSWKQANKDKVRDINKRYRKRNKETIVVINKKWRSANKEKCTNYSVEWSGKQRDNLGDWYIKAKLKKDGINPSPEIIGLKRSVIKIKRELWKRQHQQSQQM